MSLIIGLGSNIGNPIINIEKALLLLQRDFTLIKVANYYQSAPVDYTDQPFFINTVVEFQLSPLAPQEILHKCLAIETLLGRKRDIPKGPRIIDIDILFIGRDSINQKNLSLPHPRLFERSFVVCPLKELPFYQILKRHFTFPDHFHTPAIVCKK